MTERLLTDVRFASLDLEPSILRGIEDAGFEYCTPIQAQSLPAVLASRDIEGQAQTGTGKTAAFLVGIMNVLLREPRHPDAGDGQPRAIVIAPTRELAVQIHRDAEQIGVHTGLRFGVVFGGTGYESQRQMLRDGPRRAHRHPGTAHRLFQAEDLSPERSAGGGPRRSGPDVRPGIHP